MKIKDKKVLVIIPAYNEEKNIINTVKKIEKLKIKNYIIDYVVINDGSIDKTKQILIENKINYIDLACNLGIGGGMQTGYKYAFYNNYDIAIQFDGDGQHNESYIKNLLETIDNNDLVLGSRFVRELSKFKSTLLRRSGINFLSFLIKLCTGQTVKDVTSGFRAVNKKTIALFATNYPDDYPEPETLVILIKKGYKVKEIAVEMNEREHGVSSISSLKSIYYMFKVSIAIITTSLNIRKVGNNK